MPLKFDEHYAIRVEEDYIIAKYLDLTKFLSLLQTESLFFCRLDKLEDKFEGTFPETVFQPLLEQSKYLRETGFYSKQFDDQELENMERGFMNAIERDKSKAVVNCWNIFRFESTALWKIYSTLNNGIMIKSSISNLTAAFQGQPQEISISKILYKDYNKDLIPTNNIISPIVHKHQAYSYEEEIRLFYRSYDSIDWKKEISEEGIFYSIDLNKLVTEIIISPYAPEWFFKMVSELARKYGLNKPIKKSTF